MDQASFMQANGSIPYSQTDTGTQGLLNKYAGGAMPGQLQQQADNPFPSYQTGQQGGDTTNQGILQSNMEGTSGNMMGVSGGGPQSQAVASRANNQFSQAFEGQKQFASLQAQQQHLQNMHKAIQLQQAPYQIQIGAYRANIAAAMQAQNARNQMIGGLFQGGMQLAGKAVGSGALNGLFAGNGAGTNDLVSPSGGMESAGPAGGALNISSSTGGGT